MRSWEFRCVSCTLCTFYDTVPFAHEVALPGCSCLQTSATESEIKKAYYIKARQCHPDKHKDDEVATQQFQELGEVC